MLLYEEASVTSDICMAVFSVKRPVCACVCVCMYVCACVYVFMCVCLCVANQCHLRYCLLRTVYKNFLAVIIFYQ